MKFFCELKRTCPSQRVKFFVNWSDLSLIWEKWTNTTRGEKETVYVCTCVYVCVCAMPQRKFHCDYSKDRLPDLTNDMCRLLSYRSLNGLVRNHRPDGVDGDRDRKWRRDEEERSSTVAVEVKVGKSSRPSDSHWGHEVIDSWWYAWSYASYARTRDWLFSSPSPWQTSKKVVRDEKVRYWVPLRSSTYP